MNREIKFRAYSTNSGIMGKAFYPFNPDFMSEGGTFANDIVLMQFIGETDKNNKEVYEGDIVKVKLTFGSYEFYPPYQPTGRDGYSDIECICEVVYSGTSFVYLVHRVLPETSPWFEEYKLDKHFEGRKIAITVKGEVIGNIYENPELLNKKYLKKS